MRAAAPGGRRGWMYRGLPDAAIRWIEACHDRQSSQSASQQLWRLGREGGGAGSQGGLRGTVQGRSRRDQPGSWLGRGQRPASPALAALASSRSRESCTRRVMVLSGWWQAAVVLGRQGKQRLGGPAVGS